MSVLKSHPLFLLAFLAITYAISASIPVGIRINQSPESPWIAPKWADTITPPSLINQTLIQKGADLFAAQCMVCHGENGRGDGEAGFGLSVPPGDLTDQSVIDESHGSLFWKINNGRSPMPAYNEKLSELEVWGIVAYIRNMQSQHLTKIEKNKKLRK